MPPESLTTWTWRGLVGSLSRLDVAPPVDLVELEAELLQVRPHDGQTDLVSRQPAARRAAAAADCLGEVVPFEELALDLTPHEGETDDAQVHLVSDALEVDHRPLPALVHDPSRRGRSGLFRPTS